MRLLFSIILSILYGLSINAQNLVPNFSFEELKDTTAPMVIPEHWFNLVTTSDFFHITSNSFNSDFGIP
ncbi:MAG: hypothetical protein AAF573_21205, partial [Bacteroidota bacterium]